MKLSYSCESNISTLISWGSWKKPLRNKNTEPPNRNCIKKENCPLKGRCQIECVVYKVEVFNLRSNSNYRNDKKVYVGSMQSPFKQWYATHKSSFAHEIYRYKTSLSNYVWKVKNKFGIVPILTWEIVKNVVNVTVGDWYFKLCMEEKLIIRHM